jgi:hypothetical protein
MTRGGNASLSGHHGRCALVGRIAVLAEEPFYLSSASSRWKLRPRWSPQGRGRCPQGPCRPSPPVVHQPVSRGSVALPDAHLLGSCDVRIHDCICRQPTFSISSDSTAFSFSKIASITPRDVSWSITISMKRICGGVRLRFERNSEKTACAAARIQQNIGAKVRSAAQSSGEDRDRRFFTSCHGKARNQSCTALRADGAEKTPR